MSERRSESLPSTCSGDMYSGVPMTLPSAVTPCVPTARAMPKSRILALPSLSIMMLPGLRSRWTMPASWASESPLQTCLAMATVVAISRRRERRMKLLRSSPGTYSMVM